MPALMPSRGLMKLTGRLMFAFLFLSSSMQSVSKFHHKGVMVDTARTNVDQVIYQVERIAGVSFYPFIGKVVQFFLPFGLLALILLQLTGSLAFLMDIDWGYKALLLHLAIATPLEHDFWNQPITSRASDSAHFWKNISLMGSLILMMASKEGTRPGAASPRS